VLSKAENIQKFVKHASTDRAALQAELSHYNPVLLAIRQGNLDILKLVLTASGTTLKSAIKNAYKNAFINAAESGNIDMFKYLLESGLSYEDQYADGILMAAVESNQLDMVKYLSGLKHYTAQTLNKALVEAASRGRRDLASFLMLSMGASPSGAFALAKKQGRRIAPQFLSSIGYM
jgi:ankyrin repeat protein